MSNTKKEQENVISLEKYRGKRIRKPRGLTHEQTMGDPDPPTARIWLQGNIPKASLENIGPESAAKMIVVALSLCIELSVIAQQHSGFIAKSIDVIS